MAQDDYFIRKASGTIEGIGIAIEKGFQNGGRISLKCAVPFGLQHILAMFVANIAPIFKE